MANEDSGSKSANKNPAGAWPFPGLGLASALKEPSASVNFEADDTTGERDGNMLFDKHTGSVKLNDQPEFIYVPISDVSIDIALCNCEVVSHNGQYRVFGNGKINYEGDLIGVIGSSQFVSNEIIVNIYSESTLKDQFPEPHDWKSENRSILAFTPPIEADIGILGSPASWSAIAYVPDDGFGNLINAAKGQRLNGVRVTLTLSKNIYRRQWQEKAKGIAGSVTRTFRDESDVLLYLCPSLRSCGWSDWPEDATGQSASIGTTECAISFQNKLDDTASIENSLANELEALRIRTGQLEINFRWAAIIGVTYALAAGFFR